MDKLDGIEKRKVMEMMKTNQTGAITLDWMYREEKPESEEYLLGKEVDKHIEGEPVGNIEDEFDAKFGERIKANIALDMATKMREDPLFIIKQKEIEARKKIVENPIKMKQLQAMIEKQKKKQEKKDKKKKKKKHKKKGDDSDEDDLVAQYLSILSQKNKLKSGADRNVNKQRMKSQDTDSDNSDSDNHKSKNDKMKNNRERNYRERGERIEKRNDEKDRSWVRERREEGWERRGVERGRLGEGERQRRDSERNGDMKHYQVRDRERQRKEGEKEYPRDKRWGNEDKHRGNRDNSRTELQYSDRIQERHHSARFNERRDRQNDYRNERTLDNKTKERSRRHRSSSSESEREKVTTKHVKTSECDSKKDRKRSYDNQRSVHDNHKIEKSSQKQRNTRKSEESSSKSDSSEDEKIVRKKAKYAESFGKNEKRNGRTDDFSPEIKRQHNKSHEDEEVRHKPYGLILSANHQHRSSSSSQHKRKSPERRKKSPEPKSQRSKSPKRKSPKRPLTEEERDRKLAEMMDNAKWRNEQRKKNVTRYKDEDKREQEEIIQDHKSSFVNEMMSEHASQSSLEDRLNRNKHNIQRTRHALDKNFLKK